jgi:hypothetical protein
MGVGSQFGRAVANTSPSKMAVEESPLGPRESSDR